MLQYNISFIDNKAIIGILRRTCNHVDKRLMDHGIRVAYIVSRLLRDMPGWDAAMQRDVCTLAILHDVGAYKTAEIDRMLKFESNNIWEHSVYGYLFVKYFSPLREYAQAILFHHAPWRMLQGAADVSEQNKQIAQLLSIADRVDVCLNAEYCPYAELVSLLQKERGTRFAPALVDRVLEHDFTAVSAEQAEGDPVFARMLYGTPFSEADIREYLTMIIFSIDFRSRHTVTHAMTTTSISSELAFFMGLDSAARSDIVCGALLHDLGKIGVPVEILEYPGKLSPQAMSVMRSHVDITEEIFDGSIPPPIQRIALRHHEKLNGAGYPRGLTGGELTLGERIVAVADIVSALAGTRSYKEAYGKERIVRIITQMKSDGLIDPDIVDCMNLHYDEIMRATQDRCLPILDIYQALQEEYITLFTRYNTQEPQ